MSEVEKQASEREEGKERRYVPLLSWIERSSAWWMVMMNTPTARVSPIAAPLSSSCMLSVIDLGATYSATPAAMAILTNVEMSGRSSTLGRFLDMGVTDTSTAGTPINVKVKFRMNGASGINCSLSRTVPTIDSIWTHMGIGMLNQSNAPTKNSSSRWMFLDRSSFDCPG